MRVAKIIWHELKVVQPWLLWKKTIQTEWWCYLTMEEGRVDGRR